MTPKVDLSKACCVYTIESVTHALLFTGSYWKDLDTCLSSCELVETARSICNGINVLDNKLRMTRQCASTSVVIVSLARCWELVLWLLEVFGADIEFTV